MYYYNSDSCEWSCFLNDEERSWLDERPSEDDWHDAEVGSANHGNHFRHNVLGDRSYSSLLLLIKIWMFKQINQGSIKKEILSAKNKRVSHGNICFYCISICIIFESTEFLEVWKMNTEIKVKVEKFLFPSIYVLCMSGLQGILWHQDSDDNEDDIESHEAKPEDKHTAHYPHHTANAIHSCPDKLDLGRLFTKNLIIVCGHWDCEGAICH